MKTPDSFPQQEKTQKETFRKKCDAVVNLYTNRATKAERITGLLILGFVGITGILGEQYLVNKRNRREEIRYEESVTEQVRLNREFLNEKRRSKKIETLYGFTPKFLSEKVEFEAHKKDDTLTLPILEGHFLYGDRKSSTGYAEFPKEVIERVFTTFPKGWFNQVSKITFRDEPGTEAPAEYGIKVKIRGKITNPGIGRERASFILYKSQNSHLFQAIFHEMGHAMDWDAIDGLTVEDRSDLLLKVLMRLKEKDRYRSYEVENIKNKNSQQELFLKAGEYWAEIYSAYLYDPASLNLKDFTIVNAVALKSDPSYNALEAASVRKKMIDGVTHK